MQTPINLIVEDIPHVAQGCVIRFSGDLDATNVDTVVDKMYALFSQGLTNIIADFEKLRYLNSTGLGILLHMSKQAKEKGGLFKICSVNSNVSEIIELVGASTLLEMYDTYDAAVASYN